jgi:transcriptional regulator with XRE-family HTH domain
MTNRKTPKRKTPTVDVPSHAEAILDVLDPTERRVMSLRWGLDTGRPLHQTEIGNIVGLHSSTVSRIEKAARERIAELTPSEINQLVEAHEITVTVSEDRYEILVREITALEQRLRQEIARLERKVQPADPPAAPRRFGLFRRGD